MWQETWISASGSSDPQCPRFLWHFDGFGRSPVPGTSRSSPILGPMRVRCRGRIVPGARSQLWCPGVNRRGRHDGGPDHQLRHLGASGRADVSLSVASGLHRRRTHPRARRPESPRHPLPRSSTRSGDQSMRGSRSGVFGRVVGPCGRGAPNKALHLTAYSLRSFLAASSGSR